MAKLFATAVVKATWFGVSLALFAPIAAAAAQQTPVTSKPLLQAPPPQAQAPHPAQIDRDGVLILIRSTLTALDQANKTGNYTVLRDIGAPSFQAANTAARLSSIFAQQSAQNIDLSGVLVLEPKLTLLPQIEPNGMMRMAGFFPSVPTQLNFELAFVPVDGRWRIFGISVNLGSAAPVAPGPEPDQKENNQSQAPPRPTQTPK